MRLSSAMRHLADADAKGQGDLSIGHRMSSFFVFGRALARQEGWEYRYLKAVQAMEARQQMSSVEGNDILDLVASLPASYANTPRTAREWAGILSQLVPDANVELKRAAARTNWVAWQFSSNVHTLMQQCGMQIKVDKHAKTCRYSFTKLSGKPASEDLTPDLF